jgi:glycerol-3-phosphate acyltransferase PlsX
VLSQNGASAGVTVAVDAMGGDHAPREVIAGAVEAHQRGVGIVLVGLPEIVKPHLTDLGAHLPVVPAEEVIGMDEPVGQAMRRRGSSLYRAMELVRDGEAGAAVSAGNSAAIMALSRKILHLLAGIERPPFGGFLPARHGSVFVLDIGANSVVDANNLTQFAVMGEVYVRLNSDIERPRVGLLSIGSEDSKGTKEIREANEALRKLDINFIGNVEGNQVFENVADVVVCDGFTGNVLLKVAEGVAMEIFDLLKEELSRDLVSRLASAALMPAFSRVKRRVDYQEYGGAPVLGIREVMINCHGRSRAKAVTNAILLAERLAREHLPDRIYAAVHAEDVDLGRSRRLARAFHLRSGASSV